MASVNSCPSHEALLGRRRSSYSTSLPRGWMTLERQELGELLRQLCCPANIGILLVEHDVEEPCFACATWSPCFTTAPSWLTVIRLRSRNSKEVQEAYLGGSEEDTSSETKEGVG